MCCVAEALLAARPLPDLPDLVSDSGGGALDPMGGPGPPEPQHVGATFTAAIQPTTAPSTHATPAPLPVSATAQVTSAPQQDTAATAATKWHSRENLLAPEEEGDPQLFVALYEFRAQGENQLSLRKGKSHLWFTSLV